MSGDDHDFRVRPGRSRDAGAGSGRRAKRLAVEVRRAAARSGYTRSRRGGVARSRGAGRMARGGRALAAMRSRLPHQRRVTVVARIVRHKGPYFRAAPLARHVAYLERDGVTRDGREASMFDADGDHADREAFASRCMDDRHHFRFVVSPEDAGEMEDLRRFTRSLMTDLARDLDTHLDWVAIDHWNTDDPHIHILLRGRTDGDQDLVIDPGYVSEGIRARAEERVTIELGPRSEYEMVRAARREIKAERWTGLDRELAARARETDGLADLRPGGSLKDPRRSLLVGRAATLERLGLATSAGPGAWIIDPDAEAVLRDLGLRGDIIKSMHRDMTRAGLLFDPAALALHGEQAGGSIVGRLVARGLDDELAGTAYAIVDGTDGCTHRLRFADIEATGDATRGAIVELRSWEDRGGRSRQSLAVRSDLPIAEQVSARGATWLDRQLVAREPAMLGGRFGRDVVAALEARLRHLEGEGLATRQGGRLVPARDLIATLRTRDLDAAVKDIAARTGMEHRPSAAGGGVSGIYRERVTLASGRFAMIDDGLGFELVPWRPALDRHLGRPVVGAVNGSGGIDWSLGRGRGIGI